MPVSDVLIPVERLSAWLSRHGLNLAAPVRVELISGGRSNLTYAVEDGSGVRVVLRRPPADGVLETAHDMRREWRFISALRPTTVPVAQPLAFGEAGEVLDCLFYVMSHVEGLVPHDADAAEGLSQVARQNAAAYLIDTMAELHNLDIDAVGLGDVAKREDYVGRQLRRWKRQWDQSTCTDISAVGEAFERLRLLVPPQARTSIVHGDLRLGNVICGGDGVIRALLDWELATLGDPLADLGWLLSSWVQPEELTGVATSGTSPSVLPGFPSREWLISRYGERSGADLSSIDFYVAFSYWRSACISSGVLTRYEAGVMGDDGFDTSKLREAISNRVEAAISLLEAL